jgi:hypothetical protein
MLSNLKAKCCRLTRRNCRAGKRNTVRFEFLLRVREYELKSSWYR